MKTDFFNRQRLSAAIVIGVLTCVYISAQADGQKALPEPVIDQSQPLRFPHFGSDRTVELLGGVLLKSEDVCERVQAAANLGQTNNMNAVEYLEKGFADKSSQVRQAVVMAASALMQQTPEYLRATSAEYKQAVGIIKKALGDSSQEVKLNAISAAGAADVLTAEMVKIAQGNDPVLALQALNILNAKQISIAGDALLRHMKSNNLPLQIAAAENILANNASAPKTPPIAELKKLAASDTASLAAVAIEALAKLDPAAAKPFIEKAAKNISPLLRRAAVKSFAIYKNPAGKLHVKKAPDSSDVKVDNEIQMYDKIPPFLDDRSPLVKLAAVQAVGYVRKNGSLVNQTQKLMDIAFAAPDKQLHEAAIAAALSADGGNLIKIAAAAYTKMLPEYLAEENPKDSQLERNLSSVCRILAALKSYAVFNQMLTDIEKLPLDSIIIGDIADAFGRLGNKSANTVLENLLKKCQATGAKYLIAMASMSTPPAFSEDVTVKIINALVAINARDAAKSIISIAQLNVMGMRLTTVAAAVPPALVKFHDSEKSAADKLLVAMITDNSYGNTAIFNAVIAAGKLRLDDAMANLEKVLTEERPGKITIWAAAWAIGQISGKYPSQPQPVTNQGNWIIKSIK